MKKRNYLKIVWAVLALSLILGYGCANAPKGGVKFDVDPKMQNAPPQGVHSR